jgi:hypothetical protein
VYQFTPNFTLSTSQLNDTLTQMLNQNAAIDNEILNIDIPYAREQLELVQNSPPPPSVAPQCTGASFLNIVSFCIGNGLSFNNPFGSSGSEEDCSVGFIDSVKNSLTPGSSKPGVRQLVQLYR